MCVVINLWGGPGCGKSTTMAKIFSELKIKGYNVEMVSEFAKDLVYEKRNETMKDELYIFAKQNHRLFRVKDKVDVIVTDRPLPLTCVYDKVYGKNDKNLHTLVRRTFQEYDNINILLGFNESNYKEEGRLQTKEEALNLHHKIAEELELYGNVLSAYTMENIIEEVKKRLWMTKFKPGDEVFVRDNANSKWKKAILLNYEPARVYQYYTYKIDDKTSSYNKFITKEVPDENSQS